MSWIEYIGSIGGVGAVIAVLMFFAYRALISQMREDRRFMEDRLTGIIKSYHETCENQTQAVLEFTQVLTELKTWLKARNGH